MHRIDDGLAVTANLIDVFVKIADPAERLRWRRDIITLRAEHHDRGADRTQIDARTIGRDNLRTRQLIADEELVRNELHLLGVERHMAAPPFLEAEVTRSFGVDVSVEIVVLLPERIGRIQAFKVGNQPGSVELAVSEISSQRGQPAPAEQTTGVTHRILAMH